MYLNILLGIAAVVPTAFLFYLWLGREQIEEIRIIKGLLTKSMNNYVRWGMLTPHYFLTISNADSTTTLAVTKEVFDRWCDERPNTYLVLIVNKNRKIVDMWHTSKLIAANDLDSYVRDNWWWAVFRPYSYHTFYAELRKHLE